MGEVIASWSMVEAAQTELFVTLMGGPKELAAAVFLSLEGAGPKGAAIRAVAEHRLSGERLAILNILQRLAKSQQKRRDRIAHWLWGISRELPDALILSDPRAIFHPDFSENRFVYVEADFRSLIDENARLSRHFQTFWHALARSEEPGEAELQFRQLSSAPEIREMLDRLASQAPATDEE